MRVEPFLAFAVVVLCIFHALPAAAQQENTDKKRVIDEPPRQKSIEEKEKRI